MDVCRLYPQYNITSDRRTQQSSNSEYPNDRRRGVDRRSADRVKLDTGITKDIFEVRNKISGKGQSVQQDANTNPIQHSVPQKVDRTSFSQNITKAAQHSLKADTFVKTAKPEFKDSPKELAKMDNNTVALGGLMAVVLGGTIASTFLGVAGAGIALGLGAYFGGKFLKSAIVDHITNDKTNKK